MRSPWGGKPQALGNVAGESDTLAGGHVCADLDHSCESGSPARPKSQHPSVSPFPGLAGSCSEPCIGGIVFMHWVAHVDIVAADPAGTLVCLHSPGPLGMTFFAMN